MPNVYVRKTTRASWSEEDLVRAAEAVTKSKLSLRQASKLFLIPLTTLRNRLKKQVYEKKGLGPSSQLGADAEKKLVDHIKRLQAVGFAPTRKDVRSLAYNLAESLKIEHTFNKDSEMAGKVWLASFLRRNPQLSVRKGEGISRARTEAMNKEEVKHYFDLLATVMLENHLIDKPGNIWNADEIGTQLNNDPGHVIAARGSKDVHVVTSTEKGETITVLAACSAEGQFLPPYCVFKGTYQKPQYGKGAPPGTQIKMRKENGYIDTNLFMQWLTGHFIPRKPSGTNLLILDGHSAHMNSAELLQVAQDNDIVILCLPSHTTHYLQPLDRVVFKPFKTYFKDACAKLVRQRNKVSRDDYGELLNSAWSRCATTQMGIAAFRATGIYPLDMNAIPEHAYLLSCDQTFNNNPVYFVPQLTVAQALLDNPSTDSPDPASNTLLSNQQLPPPTLLKSLIHPVVDMNSGSAELSKPVIAEVVSTSRSQGAGMNSSNTDPTRPVITEVASTARSQPCAEPTRTIIVTPNKILNQISPIPKSLKPSTSKRKQVAANVTEPSYIEERKKKNAATVARKGKMMNNKTGHLLTELEKIIEKKILEKEKDNKYNDDKKAPPVQRKPRKTAKKRLKYYSSSSSEDHEELLLLDDTREDFNEDECVECFELYSKTKSLSDWIKCSKCSKWLHESCSIYKDKCAMCGRLENKKQRKNVSL